MADSKESFVFYKSFYKAIKKIPKKYQLELYDAIAQYSLTGNEPENLSGTASAMFVLIKPNIDSSQRRYEASVENGKKGGRPKKDPQKKPNQNPEETQKKPNQNLNVDVAVDDNVDVNVNDNVDVDDNINFSKIIREYEENIAPITATAKEILQSYYEDLGPELLIEAIRRASLANKRNCKYIQGILNSWINKGFKTLVEVKSEEEEFKNKKSTKETNKKGYNNYSQRDPEMIDFNKLYANMPPGEMT